MADNADPFVTFNFEVRLDIAERRDGLSSPLCRAAFAECDGLEVSMEPMTFQEGGNNRETIHLAGPLKYGELTLKRGMTATRDLWTWMRIVGRDDGRGVRAQGEVVLLGANGDAQVTFTLKDCLPTKIKAPALNARDGQIAIEELTLVYASLRIEE